MMVVAGGLALIGCGASDNPITVEEEVSSASYTMVVDVQPPISLRDEGTWGYWVTPIQVALQTRFGATEGHAEEEHAHKVVHGEPGDEEPEEEVFIGAATVGGMKIEVEAEPAEHMWMIGHEGIEEHAPAEHETHHIVVKLEETLSGHHPHGGMNVPYADVSLTAVAGSDTTTFSLRPVQTRHGLRYEANASLPLGIYDTKIEVRPPTLVRSEESKFRWLQPVVAEFGQFDFNSGQGRATTETGGMKISLRAGAPKVYGAVGMGHLPMKGDETVSFSVRLEDSAVEAQGEGEILPYATVSVRIVNNEAGAETMKVLHPMYGFHYGENFALPKGQRTGGGEEPHEDDGHSH